MANTYILNGERVSADAYNKKKYEDLRVRVPYGHKSTIKAHAESNGESLNGFINRAIEEAMAGCIWVDSGMEYTCSNCGSTFKSEIDLMCDDALDFCPRCGQKVKEIVDTAAMKSEELKE